MLGFGLREGKVVCRMGRRRGSCSRGGGPEGDRCGRGWRAMAWHIPMALHWDQARRRGVEESGLRIIL
jgi:hypothetical protein